MNTKKLIVTSAVVIVSALTVGACGSGSTTANHANGQGQKTAVLKTKTVAATPKPSTTVVAASLAGLDYPAMIPTAAAVQGMLHPMYGATLSVRTQEQLAGYGARALCGHKGPGDSVGGFMRQYLSARSDLSVTFVVESFAGNSAQDVMQQSKDSVTNCTMYRSNQGDVWAKKATNGDSRLVGIGDDALTLTLRDVNTGVTIHDAFVREGQFVYQVRVVADSRTLFSLSPAAAWEFVSQTLRAFVQTGNDN